MLITRDEASQKRGWAWLLLCEYLVTEVDFVSQVRIYDERVQMKLRGEMGHAELFVVCVYIYTYYCSPAAIQIKGTASMVYLVLSTSIG